MTDILDHIITTNTLDRPFDDCMTDLRGHLPIEFDIQALYVSPVWTVYVVTPPDLDAYERGDQIRYVAELTHTRMPSMKVVYLVAVLDRMPKQHEFLDLAHYLRRDEDG